MVNQYNRCNNCKHFKRLHTREDNNYVETQYGLCQKRKRVFADKYYCGNHKEEGGINYVDSKSK